MPGTIPSLFRQFAPSHEKRSVSRNGKFKTSKKRRPRLERLEWRRLLATDVELWDRFEVTLPGSASPDVNGDGTADNPFFDVQLSATFTHSSGTQISPDGFYDGNGDYKVRFMPSELGTWTYTTSSNLAELDGQTGSFDAVPASGVGEGPIQAFNTHHLRYADGTPFYSVGTTAYGWTSMSDSLQDETLASLANSSFNKVRMAVFPKDFEPWADTEPTRHAFAWNGSQLDTSSPNPDFFQNLENRIDQLDDLGIQADLILFHSYDEWGYDNFSDSMDDWYTEYVVARLGAYDNVWWSIANEWDYTVFSTNKTAADFDRLIGVTADSDPYGHMLGIHNWQQMWDHSDPRLTHASVQEHDMDDAIDLYSAYGKPVLLDEIRYEGDLPVAAGNLTGPEMTERFWISAVGGTYATHGDVLDHDGDNIRFWAYGGHFDGTSPQRIDFFDQIAQSLPYQEMVPSRPTSDVYLSEKADDTYLVYFATAKSATVQLAGTGSYEVERIDTWNMTRTPLADAAAGAYTISGQEGYAYLIRRTGGGSATPTVTIAAPDAVADEVGQDPATFRITRTDTAGDLSVQYAVSGSASSGDYAETLNGTATIPDGQTFVDITVTPHDDGTVEGSESLILTLASDAAYIVGAPNSANATILDADSTGPTFLTGINFNGNAVVIDGNSWLSQNQAVSNGLTLPATYSHAQVGLTPTPAADADTTHMLQSVIWTQGDMQFSQTVPNGDYSVSLWIMENWQAHVRNLDIELEGQLVADDVANLPLGGWEIVTRSVTVSDGVLNVLIHAEQADPHIMGTAIFSTSGQVSNQAPQVSLTAPGNGASFVAGEAITVAAEASDPDGSVAEVRFYAGTTLIGQDSTAPYTLEWSTTTVGDHQITARAVDNEGLETATDPVSITITAGSQTTGVSLVASATRITPGTTVQFTAQGEGATNYEYAFSIRGEASEWVTTRPYAANATWDWDTTEASQGTYFVQVFARTAGSTAPFEAAKAVAVVVASSLPATGVTLDSDQGVTFAAGTVVEFSAAGQGGSGNYEYRFMMNVEAGPWQTTQEYSSDSTWQWDTSGLTDGTYYVQVFVRNVGSPALWEAASALTLSIGSVTPATGATLVSDHGTSFSSGSVVEFTAGGQGGSGSYEYRFMMNFNEGVWQTTQAYSNDATWQWDTQGLADGTYYVQVLVRNEGSSAPWEAGRALVLHVYSSSPATGATLTSNQGTSVQPGAQVDFTAGGIGGSGSYEFQFWGRSETAEWQLLRGYSTDSTYRWDTTGLADGRYFVQVLVRNAGSPAAFESGRALVMNLSSVTPVDSVTLGSNQGGRFSVGSVAEFTAAGAGGSGSYEYRFWWRTDPGEWQIVQDYSTDATWTWDSTGAADGQYFVQVGVRNVGSSAFYEAARGMSVVVTSVLPVTDVTLASSHGTTFSAGTAVDFTATGSGGSGNYEFQYMISENDGPWQPTRGYSTNSTWQWDTSNADPGNYIVQVLARSVGSPAAWEAGTVLRVVVTAGSSNLPTFGQGREIFVAADAGAGGDGSQENPYTIHEVFADNSSAAQPGDVIWLRGGVYHPVGEFKSYLQGTEQDRILLIAYPGERVTFNSGILVLGEYTTYAGLEITDFDSNHYDSRGGSQHYEESDSEVGFNIRGNGNALINNYIHENAQGIFADRRAGDFLAYGNVIFNNGWVAPDRVHGHGTYTQNAPETRKDYQHNIYTRNFGSAFQLYGTGATQLENVHLQNNVMIKENFIIGGGAFLDNVSVDGHLTYVSKNKTFPQNDFGYGAPEWSATEAIRHKNVTVTNSYFYGGAMLKWMQDGLTFTGNTLVKPAEHAHPLIVMTNGFSKDYTNNNDSNPFVIDNNTYYGSLNGRVVEEIIRPNGRGTIHTFDEWRSRSLYDDNSTWTDGIPTGMQVFARANEYERGRGYVTVYNWDDHQRPEGEPIQNPVAQNVDITHFGLQDGDVIEVRNAEDPLGQVVTMTVQTNSEGKILVDLPLTGWTVDAPNEYDDLVQNPSIHSQFENRQLLTDPIGEQFNTLIIRKQTLNIDDLVSILGAIPGSQAGGLVTPADATLEAVAETPLVAAPAMPMPSMDPYVGGLVDDYEFVELFASSTASNAGSQAVTPSATPRDQADPIEWQRSVDDLFAAVDDLLTLAA